MTNAADGAAEVGNIVRFTTRQIEKLATAAGLSQDEVRQAARNVQNPEEKRDFLHMLGLAHASRQRQIATLPPGRERFGRMNQIALDLKSVWEGDQDVMALVAEGLKQGRTGRLPKQHPTPFTSWIERVKSFAGEAPAPAMARI
jgi:hypothetical protein